MNLKAAAQGVGLDAGSVGWAILEKLAHEGDTTEDWAEIWNAVTKGKVSVVHVGTVVPSWICYRHRYFFLSNNLQDRKRSHQSLFGTTRLYSIPRLEMIHPSLHCQGFGGT